MGVLGRTTVMEVTEAALFRLISGLGEDYGERVVPLMLRGKTA
jgi:hypothetical protein